MPIGQSILSPSLTAYVSVAALVLGIVNLVLARLSERKRDRLQRRSDELEVDRLLDKAWQHLFGPDGFEKTQSYASQQAAESAIDQALKFVPDSHRAMRLRGHLYKLRGNKKVASKYFLESLKIKPYDPWTLKALGDLENDAMAAIDLYKRSLACDPDNAWSHYGVAKRFNALGNSEAASFHFGKAADLDPRETVILNAKAELLLKSGLLNEAEATYQQVIRLEPTNVDALVGLGSVFSAREDIETAVSWMLRAARCAPGDSFPYAMIAATYADRQRPREALEYVEMAIEMDVRRSLSTDTAQAIRAEMQALLDKPAAKGVSHGGVSEA